MKVFIHIGLEKTGTTSIQNFFQINRAVLASKGICYPRVLGSEKHFKLPIFCRAETHKDDLNMRTDLMEPDLIMSFKQELPQMLEEEIRSIPGGCRKLILSSEHLSSRLFKIEELAILRQLVGPYDHNPKIIVYLRPQDEFVISSYSTYIKSGGCNDFTIPAINQQTQRRYDYYNLLQAWKEVFGLENIMVRTFEKDGLINKDIIHDFLDLTGISFAEEYNTPEKRNESFDVVTLEYLKLFNKFIPKVVEDQFNPEASNIIEVLNKITKKSLGHPPYDENKMSDFLNHFKESNSKVAREYLGSKDGILFKKRIKILQELKQTRSISNEELMQVSAQIWKIKYAEIKKLKEKIQRMDAKLKQIQSKRKPARKTLLSGYLRHLQKLLMR